MGGKGRDKGGIISKTLLYLGANSCCGEKKSPSTVLDGLEDGGIISLLGKESLQNRLMCSEQAHLPQPWVGAIWGGRVESHVGPLLCGKGQEWDWVHVRVRRREVRARGNKAKQEHNTLRPSR